jgi:hypothetical protein
VGLALHAVASAAILDPKPLTLRLADLPSGFAMKTAHYVSLAAAAKSGPVGAATYRKWGYVNGYEADYTQQGELGELLTGAGEVDSYASVYASDQGAIASWRAANASCRHLKQACTRLALAGKIGDRARLLKLTRKSGGATVTAYSVVWQRGQLRATIFAAGVGVGPSATSVVALARKQDRRMAQAAS